MLTVCFVMYQSSLQSFIILFCTSLIAVEVAVLHVVECGPRPTLLGLVRLRSALTSPRCKPSEAFIAPYFWFCWNTTSPMLNHLRTA